MATISEREAAERIGHFIKSERKRRKYTLAILAGMMDRSATCAFNAEHRTYNTRLDVLLRPLHTLGYTLAVIPLDAVDKWAPARKGELALDFDGIKPDTYDQRQESARNQ